MLCIRCAVFGFRFEKNALDSLCVELVSHSIYRLLAVAVCAYTLFNAFICYSVVFLSSVSYYSLPPVCTQKKTHSTKCLLAFRLNLIVFIFGLFCLISDFHMYVCLCVCVCGIDGDNCFESLFLYRRWYFISKTLTYIFDDWKFQFETGTLSICIYRWLESAQYHMNDIQC